MIVAVSLMGLVLLLTGCDKATLPDQTNELIPPVAEFSFSPTQPTVDQAVVFQASSGISTQSLSQPERYQWDFGDGNRAEGRSVSHTYKVEGSYTVNLTTTNSEGITSETSSIVRVVIPEPEFPFTFGAGIQIIGRDIEPGTYRTRSDGRECFWERLSGLGGSINEIIAKAFNDGPIIVEIQGGDGAFNSQGCARWTKDTSPIRTESEIDEPFGEGVYRVGDEISHGIWQSEDTGRCNWRRLAGFSWEESDVIDEAFTRETPVVLTIEKDDAGFVSSECGTWTKVL